MGAVTKFPLCGVGDRVVLATREEEPTYKIIQPL